MFIHIVWHCFICVQGFKRYGSQKSRKVSSQSQFSDRGAEEDLGMEDTESLLSDENESGDHDEPNDVNLCHNMPWIKVVNATASFLHRTCTFWICYVFQNKIKKNFEIEILCLR